MAFHLLALSDFAGFINSHFSFLAKLMNYIAKHIASTLGSQILLLSSCCFLFLPLSSFVYGYCTPSICTNSSHFYPLITSPFRTPDQPKGCGKPGFDLQCNYSDGTPLLSFPSGGQTFSVKSILYNSQKITVGDPQGCLPKKLLNFNYSGTPFRPVSVTWISLYKCPSSSNLPYSAWEIACLRGPDYSVIGSHYSDLALSSYGCGLIEVVKVPGDWGYPYSFSTATTLDLHWVLHTKGIDKIVVPLVVFLLLFIFVLGVICARCARKDSNTNQTLGSSTGADNALTQIPQRSLNTAGLEQATLDAYPMVAIGDSGRILTQMEEKACPICLSDYQPNEILKTLPECLHWFHADCIDEWLRAKALCPVCRTPPPRITSRA